jgi:hypothetical protein
MKTEEEVISICYDYIVDVTIKQNKLLPMTVLYGDGSRWDDRKDIFTATYNQIESLLVSNKINI